MTNLDDFNFDDSPTSVAPAPTMIQPRPQEAPTSRNRRAVRKGEDEAEQLAAPVTLLGLDVVDFKRIRAVKFRCAPDGITIIGGRNAQGKSSCLEAITCLLGGGRHVPDVPVHMDGKRAEIAADLQDAEGRVYRVKRVINPDRAGFLEITRPDGTQVGRAQEFLAAMQGVLWFDPCQFLRKPAREQAEDLRRLVGLDFSGLDKNRESIYQQRTMIGRDRDKAKGEFERAPFHSDAPEAEVTATELNEQMKAGAEHNKTIAAEQLKLEKGRAHAASLDRELTRVNAEAEEVRRQIEGLLARQDALEAEIKDLGTKRDEFQPKLESFESYVAAMQPANLDAIAEQMGEIEAANAKVRDNARRAAAYAHWQTLAAEWDELTGSIESIDAEKRRQIAAARFPVPGLSFDSEGANVLFNNIPLAQASGAERTRVAVAVAMQMSGGLRVCLVDEGERLDMESLAALDQTVQELGGQAIMSRVSTGDECAVIIEDGAVREAVAA